MNSYSRVVMLVMVCAAVLVASGCGKARVRQGGRMLVAASIAPMADFARNVGGDLVDVELLVPPNASPHTYQLDPDQMRLLSKASVLVLNGVRLEFWADKAISAAENPKLIVVETAKGISLIDSPDDHVHEGGNPHVWLNPIYAIRQVQAIRDAFIKADPPHHSQYTANAATYVRKLQQLDADIRKEVRSFRSKRFVAFHPAWVYFAREYGLVEAAVIEQSPGREPSPSEIRDVVKIAKQARAKAIFAEPQFSPKAAQVVADEVGAKVLMLDPIGKPPDYDYIKTMRANLKQMAEALR